MIRWRDWWRGALSPLERDGIFWGYFLVPTALIPLSAAVLRHRSWVVTLATTLTLVMCGVAALAAGSGRLAGNVLLWFALVGGLSLLFWAPGGVLQILVAVTLLTVSGVSVRNAAVRRE